MIPIPLVMLAGGIFFIWLGVRHANQLQAIRDEQAAKALAAAERRRLGAPPIPKARRYEWRTEQ